MRRAYSAVSGAMRTLRIRRDWGAKMADDRIKVTPVSGKMVRMDEQSVQVRRQAAERLVRDEAIRRSSRRFNAHTTSF